MTNARVSWNIQNKVLYIGVESRGREHRWRLSPNSADKAAILREIADVLDPPARVKRRAPRVVEHYDEDEYDEEEDEEDGYPQPQRRPRRRSNRQVAQPYPAIDPRGEFDGNAAEFIDHSRGYAPDGSAIRTPVPADPAERESMARLSRQAFEKAQAHANATAGQDPDVVNLPIIEARPKAARRTEALNSQGRGFLPAPPSETPGVHGEIQVRKRPRVTDADFYYRDTH